jgi:hypothetical protein
MLTGVTAVAVGSASTAQATVTAYTAALDGASESPPNDSPGTGSAKLVLDDVAHTMRLQVVFGGLLGTTTAAHVHAATALPGQGNAGVATMVPAFIGFPLGVTAGTYDWTFDMTDPATYNPSFLNAHGGTPAGAEAFLVQSIGDGTAYFNIHTTQFGAGEIRGFFGGGIVPASDASWGGIKTLFR